jgi:hypothetical protein
MEQKNKEYFYQLEKQKYATVYGPGLYALGSLYKGMIINPSEAIFRTFRDPLKEGIVIETIQFFGDVIDKPDEVTKELIRRGKENPIELGGELYAYKKIFDVVSPIDRINFEKVKVPGIEKINEPIKSVEIKTTGGRKVVKPTADAFSKDIKFIETETSMIKRVNVDLKRLNFFERIMENIRNKQNAKLKKYYETIEKSRLSEAERLQLYQEQGLAVSRPAITYRSGELGVHTRYGVTPNKIFLEFVNPKYAEYLRQNPTYAELMKLELIKPKKTLTIEYDRFL